MPEAVEDLRGAISTLYTVFNMKLISHLQANACKLKVEEVSEGSMSEELLSPEKGSVILLDGDDGVS